MADVSAASVDPARLVFAGGLHRSGTTPLARVLGGHPEIAGLTGTGVPEDEGAHLQDVYPSPRAFGGWGRFAINGEAHLTAESPLATRENRDRLIRAWAPYWDLDRRLLMEKSPANLVMGGFLQTVFPGSALVVIVRHPVAVAMAMQKWNKPLINRRLERRVSLSTFMRNWERAHALLESDAAGLSRLHVLRYEDLIADPQLRLNRLCGFLRLGGAIDASRIQGGRGTGYQQRWSAWSTGSLWQRRSRRRVIEEYGESMARWGYDPADVTSAGESRVALLDR